jgi:hypothetical protein
MRIRQKKVKLFNTIMTEIDSYFGIYVQAIAQDFFRQLDDEKKTEKSLGAFIRESSQPTNLGKVAQDLFAGTVHHWDFSGSP